MLNLFEGLPDEKLMEYYLKGESGAFDVIYHRYKEKVFGYLTRRLSKDSDAQEIFQNVFLKFHKSRKRYDNRYPLLKWIYTISRSELLDYLKKKKIKDIFFKEEVQGEVQSIGDFSYESEGFDAKNLEEINQLSEKEREALKLRYLSEMEYEEISQKLQSSKLHTRKMVSRGLEKIRKYFIRKALR